MASSGEEKFGNIFKLLSEHNFHLQVKDTMKCVRCKNILINACQSQCGCRFCRTCVDEILLSGLEKCPENTGNCKSKNLSNIMTDYRMNMKISKLLVKCPEQMCRHKCQLIEMKEHMRLCSKKPVQCPCHDLGCNDLDLVADKINEHMETETFNHWTMLMGLIESFRNEVAHLRRTENVNKNEKELLRNEVRAKEERLEEMKNEITDKIRKCQVEMEISMKEINVEKDNLDRKINAMAGEINVKIDSIKMEKAELSGELGDLNGKLEGFRVEVNARLDETRRSCMGQVEERLTLMNGALGRYQEQMALKMGQICIDGTRFVWVIRYSSSSNRYLTSQSEFFSPKINPYKMQLSMVNDKFQMQIWLSIHDDYNDSKRQWPFKAKVTVKVTNKATPAVCMEETKSSEIERPTKRRQSSSGAFIFPIADLSSKGLLLDNCCVVECFVDIQ